MPTLTDLLTFLLSMLMLCSEIYVCYIALYDPSKRVELADFRSVVVLGGISVSWVAVQNIADVFRKKIN